MPREETGAQISILINFTDLKKNVQIYTFNCLDSVCLCPVILTSSISCAVGDTFMRASSNLGIRACIKTVLLPQVDLPLLLL